MKEDKNYSVTHLRKLPKSVAPTLWATYQLLGAPATLKLIDAPKCVKVTDNRRRHVKEHIQALGPPKSPTPKHNMH